MIDMSSLFHLPYIRPKACWSIYCLLLLGCRIPPPSTSSLANWEIATSTLGLSSTYPIHRNHPVGSPYGMRRHPVTGQRKMHNGHDIPCRKGTPIRAVASGEVTRSEHSAAGGNMIEIVHYGKQTIHTRYLHLNRRHVRVGQTVSKGQRIGSCGSTGRSTGPHLHFEVRVNQNPIPPLVLKKAQEREWDVLYGF